VHTSRNGPTSARTIDIGSHSTLGGKRGRRLPCRKFHARPHVQDQRSSSRGDQPQSGQRMRKTTGGSGQMEKSSAWKPCCPGSSTPRFLRLRNAGAGGPHRSGPWILQLCMSLATRIVALLPPIRSRWTLAKFTRKTSGGEILAADTISGEQPSDEGMDAGKRWRSVPRPPTGVRHPTFQRSRKQTWLSAVGITPREVEFKTTTMSSERVSPKVLRNSRTFLCQVVLPGSALLD
jgi:hypothetical protein